MKKILVIKPGYNHTIAELDELNRQIRNSINDGFILLISSYDDYDIVEVDDYEIGGK